MSSTKSQAAICEKYGVQPETPADAEKVGIALDTLHDKPINGLRYPAESGTCGWYIWGGETFPTGDSDFAPLHVSHLPEYCPDAIQFLGMPPGWRFLTDGDYIDVWEDRELLNV